MQVVSLFDEELTLNKTLADVKSAQQEEYVRQVYLIQSTFKRHVRDHLIMSLVDACLFFRRISELAKLKGGRTCP